MMSEYTPIDHLSPSPAATVALTSDDRWEQWVAKGVCHDARVTRHISLVAAISLTIAGIWAAMFVR